MGRKKGSNGVVVLDREQVMFLVPPFGLRRKDLVAVIGDGDDWSPGHDWITF